MIIAIFLYFWLYLFIKMTPKGFEKLKIPVFEVPDSTDIVKYFRELDSHESFYSYSEKDRNRVVKYVVLAYDPNSACVKNNSSDLTKRKEAAAELAGYTRLKSGKFDDQVLELFNMSNEGANQMICCYLRYIVNNMIWTLIVANEQVLAEYIALLMEPVDYNKGSSGYKRKGDADEPDAEEKVIKDDKKLLEAANMKGKLREECKSIVADLGKLYKELYGDNDDLKEIITKPIRPETRI